jgi:hypothetical protein
MLLTLMEEWGILGQEGSCTTTARCKGCRLQNGAVNTKLMLVPI